jgi:hypothetical protein
MKDIAGTTLAVGDVVAFTFSDDSRLHLGRIHGFTPQQIRVQPFVRGWGETTLKKPAQIALLTSEYRDQPFSLVKEMYGK